jgi:TonB family protein
VFTADIGAGGTVSGNVEYKEYGIIMNIKPRVTDDGRIHLNLGMEVSEIQPAVSTAYALAYPLTKRNEDTELFLDDGQTLGIGGLIKQRSTEDLRKVPWLADVPILGIFFRQRTTAIGGGAGQRGDTELFITLTPKIVKQSKKEDEQVIPKETKPMEPPLVVAAPLIKEEEAVDPVVRYARLIQNRILENLTYPEDAAKGQPLQGTVKLGIKLSFLGEVLDAKIMDSSGSGILDSDALQTAKKLSPYPPFPPAIDQNELWLDIPIVYKID